MKKILVLQSGWVVVGDYEYHGPNHVLTNAAVIRRWGTSKGLGEIALHGPRYETVLDPCGTVCAHELATILIMDCDAEAWA